MLDTSPEKLIIYWLTNPAFIDKRDEIISQVDDSIFLNPKIKTIFQEYKKAYSGQKISAFDVDTMLSCMDSTLGWQPYNLTFALEELKKEKVKNLLKIRLTEISKSSSDSKTSLAELTEILNQCAKLLQKKEKIQVKHILTDVLEERETEQQTGILTGIPLLDNCTKKLRSGHFWIIGGYSNVGKTGLMLQLINSVCLQNYTAALFTLEMTSVDIVNRLLSYNEWLTGDHNVAIDRVASFNLQVFSQKNNLDDICNTIKAIKPTPPVIFIDFIQLIQTDGKSEYDRITKIATDIQNFAKSTQSCIVALSQVSNEGARTKDSNIIAFKGSGALAAACDVGIELSRDNPSDPDAKNEILINIRKNRHGRKSQKTFKFNHSTGFIIF